MKNYHVVGLCALSFCAAIFFSRAGAIQQEWKERTATEQEQEQRAYAVEQAYDDYADMVMLANAGQCLKHHSAKHCKQKYWLVDFEKQADGSYKAVIPKYI